jgi:hypothetical protein
MLPKRLKKAKNMTMLPVLKEIFLNVLRFTIGCSAKYSTIKKRTIETTAIRLSNVMKPEENQSSVWPLSRTIWRHPSPSASKANPQ